MPAECADADATLVFTDRDLDLHGRLFACGANSPNLDGDLRA
jgi:hypothetical protein